MLRRGEKAVDKLSQAFPACALAVASSREIGSSTWMLTRFRAEFHEFPCYLPVYPHLMRRHPAWFGMLSSLEIERRAFLTNSID